VAVGQYILDKDGNPVLEPNLFKWAFWLEYSHRSTGKDNRIVQQDTIDGVRVSTVFLGLDHNYRNIGKARPYKPILWETMIFCGEHDGYCRRYSSRKAAVAGHMAAIRLVKGADIVELERLIQISGGWEAAKK
jgi:hypothetical protein